MLEHSKSGVIDLLGSVLEAARVEVVRRMQAVNLPLSFTTEELRILDYPQGGGWNTELASVKVGGLDADGISARIRDETVPLTYLGLREQLTPLAAYLAETTDLVTRRYARLSGQGQSPVDVILARCISPLALYYLRSLQDLGSADQDHVLHLAEELDRLISSDVVVRVYHLPVAGVRPEKIYRHRGVSIRPLNPRERGSWAELNVPRSTPFLRNSDYTPHVPFPNLIPSTLIEINSNRPIEREFDTSSLARKVALAFFLVGYDLSAPGFITNYDWPSWSAMGRWHTPFPVSEKMHIISDKSLPEQDFKAIVELAYKMPDFGMAETTGRQVVLFRVLRALGAPTGDSGFLDLAIALEAALLANTRTELSYRFSLYGALFLCDHYNSQETFNRLKNIYEVRSGLVHGGRVKSDAILRANRDAPELARAVTRKAVESGWPEAKLLDSLALEQRTLGILRSWRIVRVCAVPMSSRL